MMSTSTRLASCSLLALGLTTHSGAEVPAKSALSPRHSMLLASGRDLATAVTERVWPGWSAEFEVLLLTAEMETLVGGVREPEGFAAAGEDPALGALATRSRVFPPTLLATMPVFGPPPTIVVGSPEATGRSSSGWLQVLLHEHFHQWQMTAPTYYTATAALDLAGDDTSGRWMLEYPFPYDDPKVALAYEALSHDLARLLRRPAEDDLSAEAGAYWGRFAELKQQLSEPAARYLDFQLWQEGVARFVELRVAEEAAAHWVPPPELAALEDFEDFAALACSAWERLFADLEAADLGSQRRVAFYALGAGMALLLDRTEADWKARYEAPRFALAPAPPSD